MKRLRVLVLSLSILLGSSICASADTTGKEGSIIKHESKTSNESAIEKVKVDKPIIIQFDNKLDTKNNNGVYVYEKNGEKPVDINVSFGEDEKELIIAPNNDFNYDTEYIIFIVNLKFKDKRLSAFNMYNFKTQSEVEKKQNDKEIADKEKSNDDIFNQPGVEEYLSTEFVSVENGVVYISEDSSADDSIRHYRPQNNYIDDINTPVYNLLKSRLEDNERGNYTRLVYTRMRSSNYCHVYISIAESSRVLFPLYGFCLEEKNIDKDINPYEAPIWLIVNALFDTKSEVFDDKYYVERLKKDLIVLFGEQGIDIYDYVISEYKYKSNEDKYFKHKKEFENITVYSEFQEGLRQLKFFFIKNDKVLNNE